MADRQFTIRQDPYCKKYRPVFCGRWSWANDDHEAFKKFMNDSEPFWGNDAERNLQRVTFDDDGVRTVAIYAIVARKILRLPHQGGPTGGGPRHA